MSGAPDVVVLGSGAAGLAAALAASIGGAEVLVLERSLSAGGTTAISGGIVWAPANHLMAQAGIPDSDVDAVGYLSRIDRGGDAKLRIEFVQDAPRVVKLLEERTELRYLMDRYNKTIQVKGQPHYHQEQYDIHGRSSGKEAKGHGPQGVQSEAAP